MKEEKKGKKKEKRKRERETRENKGKSTANTLDEKHVFFWVSAFPVAAG